MTDKEWSKLCRNIYEGKCILMLGSEFQLEYKENNTSTATSYSELLSQKIASEIECSGGKKNNTPAQRDLSQLARDFLICSGKNPIGARDDLETVITDYLFEIDKHISSESFRLLAGLPFYFVVDTNYTDLFYDTFIEQGKKAKKAHYNFKGSQVNVLNASGQRIGTKERPLVYNLYGSARHPGSIAISDYDLVQLLSNIISKSPALPADVRAELANEETSILFLGFGILSKNWYFRILLHALTSGNKRTMSYALDYLIDIDYNSDPAVLFFRDELKICLYHYTQESFIRTLADKYKAFADRYGLPSGNDNPIQLPSLEKTKIFISYKREDLPRAAAIAERLNSEFTVLWDQSSEFTGDWKNRIEAMIKDSDAFLLLQSQSMRTEPETYVFYEIRMAQEKAKRFLKMDHYLFPAFIDSKDSRLFDGDFRFISDFKNWDLSESENVDALIQEIVRCRERIKRTSNTD